MKGKRVTKKALLTLALLCFINSPLWAQEFFEDDVYDTTPPADIDDSLIILLITAIGLGYVFLIRKVKIRKI